VPHRRDPAIPRRAALLGLAALPFAGCTCAQQPARERARDAPGEGWREASFDPDADSPDGERALLFAPKGAAGRPLLVALHGRGESGRGLEVGARGWRDDYELESVEKRLYAPPLSSADLRGFDDHERLARVNASLASAPYEGLCIATPYTPDLRDRSPEGAAGFGRFVTDRLLPRARAELAGAWDGERVGLDGVSMGGRLALLVGLARPDVFGAVGALQPALREAEAPAIAAMARAAIARRPLRLRLASSDADPFLPAVRALSDALRAAAVAHDLAVWPGPHDYAWNRGPGSVELLVWHERALRGLPSP
jgi:pimeloyl-ACP methyl ester carboxylesterase